MEFGFNEKSIQCIRSLYSNSTARIRINGHLSQSIKLERGCRQGCPLSPTLFTLFIEPLVQAIREDPEINGISIKDVEYKINLFADNILLTLKNPERSIPKVMSLLRMFNWYSGYKLNTHKSQIICYNFIPNPDLQSRFDFKWDSPAIKYLGVWILKNVTKIYKCNSGPVIRTIKADLDRWTILLLDLSNQIETIKINVLYLFQLPVEVPRKDFRE